jgi:hypothetical protein
MPPPTMRKSIAMRYPGLARVRTPRRSDTPRSM